MEYDIVFLDHALERARERDIPKKLLLQAIRSPDKIEVSHNFEDQQVFLTPMSDIQYDPKSNILRIRVAKRKSVDSDMSGNVVIDYDKDGKVTNIEVMDVSIDEFARAEEGFARIKHSGREKTRSLAYAT